MVNPSDTTVVPQGQIAPVGEVKLADLIAMILAETGK
jgi:hypothetical protein